MHVVQYIVVTPQDAGLNTVLSLYCIYLQLHVNICHTQSHTIQSILRQVYEAREAFSFLDVTLRFLVTSWTNTHIAIGVIFVSQPFLDLHSHSQLVESKLY